MNNSYDAMIFARKVHSQQRRKYTNAPYTDHLAEVAGIVTTVLEGYITGRDEMISVAWLHDCIEDQGISRHELVSAGFSFVVADGVQWLSDMETGNRAERKAASRKRLSVAPDWVQTIKVADLISNTSSIVEHDPKFAVVYLEEKRLLLDVLNRADARLLDIARSQL